MSEKEYEFHTYAAVVPMLGQVELAALAADIQGNGLRQPIMLFEGKILDGRNRYKACRIVGVEPSFQHFNGEGDPIDYIVSMNLVRRQLTASQKGLAVAKIAELPRGNPALQKSKSLANPKSAQMPNRKTVAELAEEVDVSPRTVGQAKHVLREAAKETITEIEQGKKSVATAVKEIKAEKQKEQAAKEKHFDKTGYTIPESILEDWNRADSFRSTLNELHKIKILVEKALENSDLIFREIGKDTQIELTNSWSTLKSVLPYAVCPTCQGRKRDNCAACKGRGFVSEFGYKHWFAKEVIELRERAIKK
jgi:hypothetical protein